MKRREPPDDAHAGELRSRYEGLRSLLERNAALLELMAELELDLRMLVPGDHRVWERVRQLLDGTLLQTQTLNLLADGRYGKLYRTHRKIEREVWSSLGDLHDACRNAPLTLPLSEASGGDTLIVGGKAARLGELSGALPGVVPDGFVVTAAAYSRFMAQGEIGPRLRDVLQDLDVVADPSQLRARVERARDLVLSQPVPEEVARAVEGAAQRQKGSGRGRWAVRSSAVGEDGGVSFAGQFDTFLDVETRGVVTAWRRVVASAFSPRAVSYRLAHGLAELATPMAVLCMPMIDARWAGVMHTREPTDHESGTMLISAVAGRASELVGGGAEAEAIHVTRDEAVEVVKAPREGSPTRAEGRSGLEGKPLASLVALGRAAEEHLGEPLEVEWVVDGEARPFLLQARALCPPHPDRPPKTGVTQPVVAEGGTPIVAGRAVGRVCQVEMPAGGDPVPAGSVLVIPQATPEFGHLLPSVEGLIAEHGSVAGHLASLAREAGIPSVFGLAGAASQLRDGELVSLDAARGKVYAGDAWPDEDPVSRRCDREARAVSRSALHRLLLGLELTDPRNSSFRAAGCRSVHDMVRFCHERGIASLFEAGVWRDRPEASGAQRLEAPQLPNQVWVLDTGGGIAASARGTPGVAPADVVSVPFRALWRGMTAPGVAWTGRTAISLRGFASVVSTSLLERQADPRTLDAVAYMIVAAHYLNLNLRLAYHFAMIDALVDEVPENNRVRFRFWGGGAGPAQRDLRAVFLARVLRGLGFVVDRRGDLVAALMQRHSLERSEQSLEALGTLVGCSRQLDMVLDGEARVEHFVERFEAGDYEAFA